MRAAGQRLEALLDREGGSGLLFHADRSSPNDRATRVGALDPEVPMWFVGDLHGDSIALEAALALVDGVDSAPHGPRSRLVCPGDFHRLREQAETILALHPDEEAAGQDAAESGE